MSEKRMVMSESQFEKMLRTLKEKDAEIKRLNELVEAGKEDRKEIDELLDDNLRLRDLLLLCQPYVEAGMRCDFEGEYGNFEFHDALCNQIKEEVGDE